MNVDDDPRYLLLPEDVELYLYATGWSRGAHEEKFSIWQSPKVKGRRSTVVEAPQLLHVRDYRRRVQELVMALCEFETRKEHDVLMNLAFPDRDIVRWRAVGGVAEGNTLPMEVGQLLLKSASAAMAASALATVATKPYFDGRHPDQVKEYVRGLRLGQTEPGSYTFTVVSGVRAVGSKQMDLQLGLDNRVPVDSFRRGVTRTLGRALAATHRAAKGARLGETEMFEAVSGQGVSANLLEAIGELAKVPQIETLNVGISWAPIQREAASAPTRTSFQRSTLEVIGKAGAILRTRYQPKHDFLLRGYVRRLDRPEDAFIGRAVVEGSVEGSTKKVSVDLEGPDLAVAVDAIADDQKSVLIECFGKLERTASTYWLRDAHSFRRVPPEEIERADPPPPSLPLEVIAESVAPPSPPGEGAPIAKPSDVPGGAPDS